MTRYKEYLRSKGYKLGCDYPILPDPDTWLVEVLTDITEDYIAVTDIYAMGAFTVLIGKNGKAYVGDYDENEF